MNIYKRGVEWLAAAGLMKPLGKRVILKAILSTDGATIKMAKDDTRSAVCHEVKDVGPEVTKVNRGDMVIHISTATDAADFDKVDARYIFCHEDDIMGLWDHQKALTAHRQCFPEDYPSHAQESPAYSSLVPEV